MNDTPTQGLNYLLNAVFRRGAQVGVRYPNPDAIPDGELTVQLQAFMGAWHGRIWTPDQWVQARIAAGLVKAEPAIVEHRMSLGAQMGHPGGHYG